jgi:hypothetical protein
MKNLFKRHTTQIFTSHKESLGIGAEVRGHMIVQKKSGTGTSVTFDSPVTPNNTVVVLVAVNQAGAAINDCTDDLAQSYYFVSNVAVNGDIITGSFTRSFSGAVQTVTLDLNGATGDIFIYEVTQPEGFPSYDDNIDAWDTNTGSSANPEGSGLYPNWGLGSEEIAFAICRNTSAITGAAAGYTLDAVGSSAVIYRDAAQADGNITDDSFVATSSNFAISELTVYSPASSSVSVSPTSFSSATTPPGQGFVNRVWQVGEDLVSRTSQTLTITCSGDFSLSVDNPYLTFNGKATLSGTGNQTVAVQIAPDSNFPQSKFGGRAKSGVYTATISLVSGSDTVTVPAEIQIAYSDFLDGPTVAGTF